MKRKTINVYDLWDISADVHWTGDKLVLTFINEKYRISFHITFDWLQPLARAMWEVMRVRKQQTARIEGILKGDK